MYRFLLSLRWLGLSALALALAATMVGLGFWQLSRYHQRSAINNRIDASVTGPAVPVASVLPAPAGTAGKAGAAPPESAAWTRVTATGHYDPANQILVRGRTVNGQVGFEIVTPLLIDGASGQDPKAGGETTGGDAKAGGGMTAVLVDRGWVAPAADAGALAMPKAPATPTGPVTVAGRLHLTESRPGSVDRREGWIETRRVSVPRLATELPYPVFGAYLLLDDQQPPADERLVPVPVEHENAWMNASYVVQWWLLAGLTLAGLVWLARREAHEPGDVTAPAPPADAVTYGAEA